MNAAFTVFVLLMLTCLILALVSIFTPRLALPFKHKTRPKSFGFWLSMAIVCLVVSGLFAPAQSKTDVQQLPSNQTAQSQTSPKATETLLAYREVSRDKTVRPAIKRDRLEVIIVPVGDQSKATQADLAATAMRAAEAAQKETGLPVVTAIMLCQRIGSPFAERQLALARYIPDGKGISGSQPGSQWESVMASERGFTAQELEYLRLWGELRGSYQKDGVTDDKALSTAIHKKMGLEPDTLKPHFNVMQKVES